MSIIERTFVAISEPQLTSGDRYSDSVGRGWYNITSTIIVAGAEDADFGNYTCSVCRERGTENQQCDNATLTLHLLGNAPTLEKAVSNGMYKCVGF